MSISYILKFNNINILEKIFSIITLFVGIYLSLGFVLGLFKKIGYIISKENIICMSLFNKNIIPWDQIVSQSITGDEKKNDLYLNLFTAKSLKNKGIIRAKWAIRISSKLHSTNEPFPKLQIKKKIFEFIAKTMLLC